MKNKQKNILAILSVVKENKEKLFRRFSDQMSKQEKIAAWEIVL